MIPGEALQLLRGCKAIMTLRRGGWYVEDKLQSYASTRIRVRSMKSAFIGSTWIKMGEEELGRRVIRGVGLNHGCTNSLCIET